MFRSVFQHLSPGRMDRHRHGCGYAAVVLEGGYAEAGDRGRFRVGPGQILIHGPWESHMDVVALAGARVLNLPVICDAGFGLGRVKDPDTLARAAERNPADAAALLNQLMEPLQAPAGDWPDELAFALRGNPGLELEFWADAAGLRPETISRGFRKAFGVSPRRYRAEQRALAAVRALRGRDDPPAALAAELGFADQAHMSRSVSALTGLTPGRLRIKSVQS